MMKKLALITLVVVFAALAWMVSVHAADTIKIGFHAPLTGFAASAHTAIMVAADALGRAASTDPQTLRKAIATTNLKVSTGTISFNSLGEVMKAVQNQVVKNGNWHRHSVIDDPALLAPPDK
jgi:branched-chain amino acid transport system substrate-binding protein